MQVQLAECRGRATTEENCLQRHLMRLIATPRFGDDGIHKSGQIGVAVLVFVKAAIRTDPMAEGNMNVEVSDRHVNLSQLSPASRRKLATPRFVGTSMNWMNFSAFSDQVFSRTTAKA